MTAQLERQPGDQNSLVLALSLTKKGILTYGHCHCQVLIHPVALRKQKLWSLPGPRGTPADF